MKHLSLFFCSFVIFTMMASSSAFAADQVRYTSYSDGACANQIGSELRDIGSNCYPVGPGFSERITAATQGGTITVQGYSDPSCGTPGGPSNYMDGVCNTGFKYEFVPDGATT